MSENESIVSTPLVSLPDDWTITFTGGEDVPVISMSDSNDYHHVALGVGDFLHRTNIEFKTRQPSISKQSPSGYTQQRSMVLIKVPKALPDGSIVINTMKLEMATDVNTTLEERRGLRAIALQVIANAQTNRFWKLASVS